MTARKCRKPETANNLSGYRTYDCRCKKCTKANREAMKRWRHATGRTKKTLVPVTPND